MAEKTPKKGEPYSEADYKELMKIARLQRGEEKTNKIKELAQAWGRTYIGVYCQVNAIEKKMAKTGNVPAPASSRPNTLLPKAQIFKPKVLISPSTQYPASISDNEIRLKIKSVNIEGDELVIKV
jgi:hypothetical protein